MNVERRIISTFSLTQPYGGGTSVATVAINLRISTV